jgi:hypothetical protein
MGVSHSISPPLARRFGVVLSIALGPASRTDQIEWIERPDWLILGGANAAVACLTPRYGPSVYA